MDIRWVISWIISACCFAAGYLAMRRSGLQRLDALALAIPFFPAPLTIALGGGNSFLYLIDVMMPVLWLMALSRLGLAAPGARRLAIAIVVGAGLIPLAVTLLWSGNRNAQLFAIISAYRLTGIGALLIIGSAARVLADRYESFRDARFAVGLSWACIILSIAVVLQYARIIDCNIFYRWDSMTGTTSAPRDLAGLAVAGLFRGSLGIVGLLGIIAFFATRASRKFPQVVAIAGAIGGFVIILMTGSKTSLVLAVFIMAFGALVALRRGAKHFALMTLLMIAMGGAAYIYVQRLPSGYVQQVLGTLTSESSSLKTLHYRQALWSRALEEVAQRPRILLGMDIVDPGTPGGAVASFHNEYIGFLVSGGVLSLGIYLFFLMLLGWRLLRNFRLDRPVIVLAALALLVGVGQAITVNHLVPGLFFVCTTGLFGVIYGLSLNPVCWADPEPCIAEGRILLPAPAE